MWSDDPFQPSDDTPVYVISVAAQLSGLHPQTLRAYDRMGLVSPGRATGRGRRYSARDIQILREVQRLSAQGVNLAGIKQLLELQGLVSQLRERVAELEEELEAARHAAARNVADVHASYRRDLMPMPDASVVVWRPQSRRRGL